MNKQINILVTGANGQLGSEFRSLEKKYPDHKFFFTTKDDLPVSDEDAISKIFSNNTFTHCINCAAYTAVDKAEAEHSLALEINATAVGKLANACKKNNIQFFHISTDYVFDGNGTIPYKETDALSPVNMYGASKLEGEKQALTNNPSSVIIRTSWVYSSYGKNFVKTMLRLMSEKESIGVVSDQLGCPTYAADLAEAIMKIITGDIKIIPGIYHYSNEGVISWYDFAVAIKKLSNSNCVVNPIETTAYPTPAKRPKYSVMDTTKIKNTYGITIPAWEDSLKKCIELLLPTAQ